VDFVSPCTGEGRVSDERTSEETVDGQQHLTGIIHLCGWEMAKYEIKISSYACVIVMLK
jgi:hypothetical protein